MRIIHLRLEVEGRMSSTEMTEMMEAVVAEVEDTVAEDFVAGNDEVEINLFYRIGEEEEGCLEIIN